VGKRGVGVGDCPKLTQDFGLAKRKKEL